MQPVRVSMRRRAAGAGVLLLAIFAVVCGPAGLATRTSGAAVAAEPAAIPVERVQAARGGGICADTIARGAPSQDLYCIPLIATPDLRSAGGMAELGYVPTPFGIAVTVDGRPRHDVSVDIHGLPDPSELGPYTTYVAWAAPPNLHPVIKLGEVRNGRSHLGEVALTRIFVLISAEPSADVTERTGRLVLRGMSSSTRMRDLHVLQVAGGDAEGGHEHAGHADSAGWSMPPMDPRVQMLAMPAVEALTPAATPFLPGRGVDPTRVPLARPRELVEMQDGDTLQLEAGLVRRRIKGRDVVMYAFNGQYPGPLIRVRQAATVHVDFHNALELPTAVHWHGIRLENAFDGVPHVTQEPVPPGGSFHYRIRFPDAGVYWYHPHHREDLQQDLGLYGNLLVESADPAYYGPANREHVLMLDDLLLGEAGLVPWGSEHATHAVMGRFGNVLLVNGEPSWTLEAKSGEVVRLFLTNASNVRTFNLSLPGARMKVVASDVGRFEREEWVESVVISPAERYVVDLRFDAAGDVPLVNVVQPYDHNFGLFLTMADTLGIVRVSEDVARPDHGASFDSLRAHGDVLRETTPLRSHLARPPDLELDMRLELRDLPFELEQLMRLDTLYFNPVEWSGTMPMMDWIPTSDRVRWLLREPATGRINEEIRWTFRVGDVVKLRLSNSRHSLHAMHHPIHIHGQRFLVLAVNDVPNENLAWKDTVLVPVGAAVDILLELSNPGRWMLHCHVAEHLEAGMHFVFEVGS